MSQNQSEQTSASARTSNLSYTIIIPNYNGMRLIGGCLDSLKVQIEAADEVIVVDDGSLDESVAFLRQAYPWVKLIVRPKNGGFAAACNDGLDAASKEIAILFNNDAEAQAGWLAAVDRAFEQFPAVGMVASKLMIYDQPTIFNSASDYYRTDGLAGNRGYRQEDRGQFDQPEMVFGPCGAAAAYRQTVLDEVRADNDNGRVLDETLFMYLEDVDLNLRLQLRGYACVYQPKAVVRHRLGATSGGKLSNYQFTRNLSRVALKNLPASILWPNLPFMLILHLVIFVQALLDRREETNKARLRGLWAALTSLPQVLRQRKKVQARRRVDGRSLKKLFYYNMLYKRLYRTAAPRPILVDIKD